MEITDYLQFLAALIFVLAMMGGLAFFLKKLGLDRGGVLQGNRQKRLKLVETLHLDSKTKLAIVQCDERQHLVLLGQSAHTVLDNNLSVSDQATDKT
jgi:flagellar protein FliO/FliZ